MSRPTPRPRAGMRRPEPRDLALATAPLVAGTIVGVLTNADGATWYRRLAKPAWTPPDAVFGPVWSVLYLLMGAASVIVARAGRERLPEEATLPRRRADAALAVYGAQLLLNLAWSVVFFGARRIRPAAVEIVVLWLSVVVTLVAFLRVRVVAGLLLVPYLAWTTFAAALNIELARRNPSA